MPLVQVLLSGNIMFYGASDDLTNHSSSEIKSLAGGPFNKLHAKKEEYHDVAFNIHGVGI